MKEKILKLLMECTEITCEMSSGETIIAFKHSEGTDDESEQEGFLSVIADSIVEKLTNTKPIIYRIDTCMGKISNSNELSFLTDKEIEEFNTIGYTGRNSNGEKSDYESYLNSLEKGSFTVVQTKNDSGDFSEGFTISRVITKPQ